MSKKKFQGKKSGITKTALAESVFKFFTKNPGKTFNYKQVSAEIEVDDE